MCWYVLTPFRSIDKYFLKHWIFILIALVFTVFI